MSNNFPIELYAQIMGNRPSPTSNFRQLLNAYLQEKQRREAKQRENLMQVLQFGGQIPEPQTSKLFGIIPQRTDPYSQISPEIVQGAGELSKLYEGKGEWGWKLEQAKEEAKRKQFDTIMDLLKLKELTPEMIKFTEEYYPEASKLQPFKREATKEQALEYYQKGVPMPGLTMKETAKLAGLAETEIPKTTQLSQEQKKTKVIGAVRAGQGKFGFEGSIYPIKSREDAYSYSMQSEGLDPDKVPEIKAEIDKKFPLLGAEDQQALDWANANPKDRRAREIKRRLSIKYPHLGIK